MHLFKNSPRTAPLLRGVIPYAHAAQTLNPSIVYLPPSFSPTSRYPVVYLLHGMPGSPLEYAHDHRACGLGGRVRSTPGSCEPFIAVAPSAAHVRAGEWAGIWERYLVDGVIPWVDANLPTIASADGRVLAGLSAGGFGAYDIGLRHPRSLRPHRVVGRVLPPARRRPVQERDARLRPRERPVAAAPGRDRAAEERRHALLRLDRRRRTAAGRSRRDDGVRPCAQARTACRCGS